MFKNPKGCSVKKRNSVKKKRKNVKIKGGSVKKKNS
jgi:hypothetical protein